MNLYKAHADEFLKDRELDEVLMWGNLRSRYRVPPLIICEAIADLFSELDGAPFGFMSHLKSSLVAGRVDGLEYFHDGCGCFFGNLSEYLAGTHADEHEIEYAAKSRARFARWRTTQDYTILTPTEMLFANVAVGATPESSVFVRFVIEAIDFWSERHHDRHRIAYLERINDQ